MQELIISYPRSLSGYFRIRDTPGTPGRLVQSISGQSAMLRTDNENGRLHVLAEVEYSEYVGKLHAHLYCGAQAIMDVHVPDGAELYDGYARICHRRQFGDWRIKIEPDGQTIYVDAYEGVINHDWYDESQHLYHLGQFYHYENRAILVPGLASRPDKIGL